MTSAMLRPGDKGRKRNNDKLIYDNLLDNLHSWRCNRIVLSLTLHLEFFAMTISSGEV